MTRFKLGSKTGLPKRNRISICLTTEHGIMEQGQSFSSWEETVTPLAAKPAAVRAFQDSSVVRHPGYYLQGRGFH